MFTLYLDVELRYYPLMEDDNPAVILHTRVNLPFAPADGLRIHSSKIDNCQPPLGFQIRNVIWDADKQVFMATTDLGVSGAPIGIILEDVRDWLRRGWTVGSYLDTYLDKPIRHVDLGKPNPIRISEERLEQMYDVPIEKRPKAYTHEFNAWVRFVVDSYRESYVYAMARTGRLKPLKWLRNGEPNPEWAT